MAMNNTKTKLQVVFYIKIEQENKKSLHLSPNKVIYSYTIDRNNTLASYGNCKGQNSKHYINRY